MGRHRRTTSASAAADRTLAATGASSPGSAQAGEVPPERPHRGAHRHRRSSASVRTGLLGASAAVAVGAIAVASGVLPGGDSYSIGGGDGSDQVRTLGTPSGLKTLGGTEGPASATPSHPASTRTTPGSASKTPGSPGAHDPAAAGGPDRPTPHKTSTTAPTTSQGTVTKTPVQSPTAEPGTPSTKPTLSAETAAAQDVLKLVNQERSNAGCSALRTDDALADLASAFSKKMADEGFFDHTDPEGLTPWDRAAKAGITGLGGENIARGQADAAAVMDSWMNSAGHRANILNCDYTTIGIGVHFGTGGPWWTQDFGF